MAAAYLCEQSSRVHLDWFLIQGRNRILADYPIAAMVIDLIDLFKLDPAASYSFFLGLFCFAFLIKQVARGLGMMLKLLTIGLMLAAASILSLASYYYVTGRWPYLTPITVHYHWFYQAMSYVGFFVLAAPVLISVVLVFKSFSYGIFLMRRGGATLIASTNQKKLKLQLRRRPDYYAHLLQYHRSFGEEIPVLPDYHLHHFSVDSDDFFEADSIVSRSLPFLSRDCEIISNDEMVLEYHHLFAKPDLILRQGKTLFMVEFKSSQCSHYSASNKIHMHMLQLLCCVYAYAKIHAVAPAQIKPYLRYLDACIYIPECERFFEYIEFALKIYIGQPELPNEVSSTELAKFICLLAPEIQAKPANESEASLRGVGRHAIFSHDEKIPSLLV